MRVLGVIADCATATQRHNPTTSRSFFGLYSFGMLVGRVGHSMQRRLRLAIKRCSTVARAASVTSVVATIVAACVATIPRRTISRTKHVSNTASRCFLRFVSVRRMAMRGCARVGREAGSWLRGRSYTPATPGVTRRRRALPDTHCCFDDEPAMDRFVFERAEVVRGPGKLYPTTSRSFFGLYSFGMLARCVGHGSWRGSWQR